MNSSARHDSVSIIIPTINEGKSIGIVIDSIKKTFSDSHFSYEIVVVDSDSTDDTKKVALSKGCRVINESRRGYGRAYKRGFAESSGNWIVTLDGDGTYDCSAIPGSIEMAAANGWNFITFKRIRQKGAMSFKHMVGNFILSTALVVLFGVNINDSQSGMWIIRRDILKKFTLTSDGMSFSEEIKIEGFRKTSAKELSVNYFPRIGDPKLLSWRDGWKNLSFLFKKRFS